MADETPFQVLHEPGRRAQTKSYMWGYSAVGKTEDYQSSFINIQKPVLGITQ